MELTELIKIRDSLSSRQSIDRTRFKALVKVSRKPKEKRGSKKDLEAGLKKYIQKAKEASVILENLYNEFLSSDV